MNRMLPTLIAMIIVVFTSVAPLASAQTGGPAQFEKLSEYLDNLNEHDKFMAAVVVSKNGQILFEHYAGQASIGEQPLSAATRFRIGSITKTYVATLVMQLIEQKRLSLSTPLADYYPDFANAQAITIEYLLSHRSGISNFTDNPAYSRSRLLPTSKSELLTRLLAEAPQFDPGAQHRYSNSNYLLLGWILEDIYAESLAAIIAKQITEPLGLSNTVLGSTADPEPSEAKSYRMSQKWVVAPPTHLSVPAGAGAMIATARDVDAFIFALFNGDLVSKESVSAMRQLQQGYGLGLVGMPFYQQRFYGHNGSIDGFLSSTAFNAADGLALTVLSNGVNYGFNDVLIAALSAAYGVEFTIQDFSQQPVDQTPDVLGRATGSYASEQLPLDITFTLINGELFAQATGQNQFPLTSYSALEYRFDSAGITIIFEPAADAPYQTFILHQGGRKYTYHRKGQ